MLLRARRVLKQDMQLVNKKGGGGAVSMDYMMSLPADGQHTLTWTTGHAEFGNEEKDEIIPAIEEAKKLGINADGPLPCDTSFITAYKNKNHDCIVGMYHDALQSGLKAFGFDRGVTVQGGLPVPITTPAHGTAFDIAGKNEANLEPTLNSFKIALTMAENKNKQ